jgi:hypothetical protein
MYELTLKIEDELSLVKLATLMEGVSAEVIDFGGFTIDYVVNDHRDLFSDPIVCELLQSPATNPKLFVGLIKLLQFPWGLALLKYFAFDIEMASNLAKNHWFTTFNEETTEWSAFNSVEQKNHYLSSAIILPIDFSAFLHLFDDGRYLILDYFDESAGEVLLAVFKYKC